MTTTSLYAKGARRKGGAARWYAFRIVRGSIVDAAGGTADVFVLAFSHAQGYSIAADWLENGGAE